MLWLTITGLGFGLSLIPAMNGGLSALPRDRAGSGSGLLMTLRQVGGAIGIALLGSLLAGPSGTGSTSAGCPRRPPTPPGSPWSRRTSSPSGAGSAELAASANSAYVHGTGVVLLVCGIAALVSALLAAFLPGTPEAGEPESPDMAAAGADARQ